MPGGWVDRVKVMNANLAMSSIALDPTTAKIATTVVGLALIITLTRFSGRWLGGHIRDTDARYRLRKLVTFLGYVVAFVFLTIVFKDRLGELTVALGVAGAGIAFALQEVIASVAGWAAVTLSQFFRVGDRVELGGIRGDVIDIGMLRTTLMEVGEWVKGDLYNGRIVRVANSFVFKAPVFNYSADFPFLWDEIKVPIRYGSDHRLARQLIEGVLQEEVGPYAEQAKKSWHSVVQKYRIEDARIDPLVTLVATDNWVEFTARYVVDYRRRRSTADRLYTLLIDAILATEGRVTVASATLELVQSPAPPGGAPAARPSPAG